MTQIQDTFLTYANRLFKDDPAHLKKVFDTIYDSKPNILKGIIQRVIILAKYRNPSCINEFLSMAEKEDHKKFKDPFFRKPFDTAAEAVYGYRDEYCKNKCFWRSLRRQKIGESLFEGSNRINCLECNQLFFIKMLSEIIEGKKYSEIEGFENFLAAGRGLIKHRWNITSDSHGKKLEDTEYLKRGGLLSGGGYRNHKFTFQDYLNGYVSYSLGEFLQKNDRRKIKNCVICNDFFVAVKDIKREVCYPPKDCEKIRNKQYQKIFMAEKRDPNSPKFDSKYIR